MATIDEALSMLADKNLPILAMVPLLGEQRTAGNASGVLVETKSDTREYLIGLLKSAQASWPVATVNIWHEEGVGIVLGR